MNSIVNLTPHQVVLQTSAGPMHLPVGPKPLRLGETLTDGPPLKVGGTEFPVRFVEQALDDVSLPPERDGTVYLVAQLVARAFPERRDFFFPYDLLRDDAGNVIGAAALGQVAFPHGLTSKENNHGNQ